MQPLVLDQTTSDLRRIPLRLVSDADGITPVLGATVAAAELQVSKNGGAEANRAGTITEVGGGGYYYEATAAELDTPGYLSLRLDKANVKADIFYAYVGASATAAAAILDLTDGVESVVTVREALRAIFSACACVLAGAGTASVTIQDANNTKARITATVDALGNRTIVTRDLT